MLQIRNFLDCPEALPVVAKWIYDRWFVGKPGHSIDSMLLQMREGKRDEVPLGLVAFIDDRPVGTVSLLSTDLEERKDLSPWLAGLLVLPESRGFGVGSALVKELIKINQASQNQNLYLYTEIPSFYERLGWNTLCAVKSKPGYVVMIWEAT